MGPALEAAVAKRDGELELDPLQQSLGLAGHHRGRLVLVAHRGVQPREVDVAEVRAILRQKTLLGETYLKMRERDKAVAAFQRVLSEAPYFLWYRNSLVVAITVTAAPTTTPRIAVDFPIGHRKRRAEGMPVLVRKFEDSVAGHFPARQCEAIKQMFSRTDLDLIAIDGQIWLGELARFLDPITITTAEANRFVPAMLDLVPLGRLRLPRRSPHATAPE